MKNKWRVGIVGAGLLGRLLAWRLVQKGCDVSLFDKGTYLGEGAAAYAAGGMLSLLSEQETADLMIYQFAQRSLPLWRQWLRELQLPVFFREQGSLVLAHTKDRNELDHFIRRMQQRTAISADSFCRLDSNGISNLESELNFQHGYFLKKEGQIDARGLLSALANECVKNKVTCHFQTKVTKILPRALHVGNQTFAFDWVFDCRGIGAQSAFSDLRAVRGELIVLQAPDVCVSRVIWLLHPRYRIYIVPRPKNLYLIGATEIEAFDDSPISVRSCLELLSGAYSVHKGFAEARILETIVAMRPAFSDNLPRIFYQPGLMAINGLYRHGFLIAPAIVSAVVRFMDQIMNQIMDQNIKDKMFPNFIKEVSDDEYKVEW